jgi:hypothetical protein
MIQDVTKSALSFSWALSLLTVKQAVSIMQPGQQPGANLFAPLTQAASAQLDESMRDVHRSGENVQARIVDIAFSVFDPSTWTKMSAQVGLPGAGNAGMEAGAEQLGNLMNLVNPLTWMNRLRSMQNCGPCQGDAGSSGR